MPSPIRSIQQLYCQATWEVTTISSSKVPLLALLTLIIHAAYRSLRLYSTAASLRWVIMAMSSMLLNLGGFMGNTSVSFTVTTWEKRLIGKNGNYVINKRMNNK